MDQKCYDLAKSFLWEIPGAKSTDIAELAQAIQTACEYACQEVETRFELENEDEDEDEDEPEEEED